MSQSPEAVASFLNINPVATFLHLTDEDRSIIDCVTSRDAFELAMLLVQKMDSIKGEYMMSIVTATWDKSCLEEASERRTYQPEELRTMFNDAPSGGLAQLHIIGLLAAKDRLS